MKFILCSNLIALFSCVILQTHVSAEGINNNFYVKASATGTGDGTSWTNAFTSVQGAIDAAVPGDVICVAAGTYFPSHRHAGDLSRHATFYINKDIILYGGFSGEPGTEGIFTGRNPNLHVTMLSGDLGVPGEHTDNAFHVVYFDHVSDSSRLDGFVIEHGNGFGGAGFESSGAGIFNNADAGRSNPELANCIIRDNNTSESGGGFMNFAQNGGEGNPMLLNCVFLRNRASGGGGMVNYTDNAGVASPTLINCRFMANSAPTADGGAIGNIGHSATVSPRFINCIFSGNHSSSASAAFSTFVTGTGIANPEFINSAFSGNVSGSIRIVDLATNNSTIRIRNSILWGNGSGANHGLTTTNATADVAFSVIPFGFPGEGNIGLDPMFVSQPPIDSAHTLGDLHLLPGSLAFDAGRNTDVPVGINTDLDDNPRFINALNGQAGIVDLGPYEFQDGSSAANDFLDDADWKIYPNPAGEFIHIDVASTSGDLLVNILDLHGKLISSQSLVTGDTYYSLDVSAMISGMYIVKLMTNGKSGSKKLIIGH